MEIRKGQRSPLTKILQNNTQNFQIELAISGVKVDFLCFGLNVDNKLLSDEYKVFFNQPQSPCGAVSCTTEMYSAIFSCDLSQLPEVIEKLSFTAAIVGEETMQQIQSGHLRFLVDGQEVAYFHFDGSDFNSEKSLMLGDIYRKNGEWRFNAVAQGFNGGLEKLVSYFGGNNETIKNIPTQKEKPMKFEGNIFTHLSEQSKQIETQWTEVFQGILEASVDYAHIDAAHLNALNEKIQVALQRLNSDLESPTLILATTGTTSSGKSTIVNLLCGADLMPRMAQEMSAGVVYIHHSPDKKRKLTIHPTDGAFWECGEWHNLTDDEIQARLTNIMDSFNKSRGKNQPATPHIELTYPIACFNDENLLKLTSIPPTTQFKIMDLPGLRNQQDNTNGDDIKNCRDALCLVAYNMEETDENRRLELVNQVLQQIKQMGGSPARMLFVLNRIDVFRKDPDWERYQSEHIIKTQAEITDILHRELPEHRDVLATLSYSPLSSLPALHSQRIKTGNNKAQAAEELDKHFSSLISQEILDDLPRSSNKWSEREFERVGDAVWQNSYGGEFFNNLDNHIQAHFPTLVIPTIVRRLDEDMAASIDDVARTCYSELNSSKEGYEKAIELLHCQNVELIEFLEKTKETLLSIFNNLLDDLKKNQSDEMVFEFLVEDLLKTNIYYGKFSPDKLSPLFGWVGNLRSATHGTLEGMKQTLDQNSRDFSGTSAKELSEQLQQQLTDICLEYNKTKRADKENEFEHQLNDFLYDLSKVFEEVVVIQSDMENKRIYDAIELLMKHYLNYLQQGIENIAPEWNLSIGHHILKTLNPPKIKPLRLKGKVENRSYEKKIWWTFWIFSETIHYKALPDSNTLYKNGLTELNNQIESLIEPFHAMIRDYIIQLNDKIEDEQDKVLKDIDHKLTQAHMKTHDDYDKVLCYWESLNQKSQGMRGILQQLKQLVDGGQYG